MLWRAHPGGDQCAQHICDRRGRQRRGPKALRGRGSAVSICRGAPAARAGRVRRGSGGGAARGGRLLRAELLVYLVPAQV